MISARKRTASSATIDKRKQREEENKRLFADSFQQSGIGTKEKKKEEEKEEPDVVTSVVRPAPRQCARIETPRMRSAHGVRAPLGLVRDLVQG